jgi:hypothetical protein
MLLFNAGQDVALLCPQCRELLAQNSYHKILARVDGGHSQKSTGNFPSIGPFQAKQRGVGLNSRARHF